MHCTMNSAGHCCNHSTTVTLKSLISMFCKWTVQCVHLHNMQLNSDSPWLHSHNWIEEIEVDNWMQDLYVNIQYPFINFNFTAVTNTIPHIFDTLLWYLHKLHCLKVVCMNVLYILCIGHLPDFVPEMAKQCEGLAITCDGNRMRYSCVSSSVYSIRIKTIKSHNTSTSTIKFNTLIYSPNINITYNE